jgi:hypothetical protein
MRQWGLPQPTPHAPLQQQRSMQLEAAKQQQQQRLEQRLQQRARSAARMQPQTTTRSLYWSARRRRASWQAKAARALRVAPAAAAPRPRCLTFWRADSITWRRLRRARVARRAQARRRAPREPPLTPAGSGTPRARAFRRGTRRWGCWRAPPGGARASAAAAAAAAVAAPLATAARLSRTRWCGGAGRWRRRWRAQRRRRRRWREVCVHLRGAPGGVPWVSGCPAELRLAQQALSRLQSCLWV